MSRPAARLTLNRLALLGVLAMVAIFAAPELLAFPYRAQVGDTVLRAERPIGPEIAAILARADALTAASPIDAPGHGRRIFLTDGGWRWRILSVGAPQAFAMVRSFGEAVVVNRSDIRADRVVNGRRVGGVRPLSAVIAHERVHLLARARYGAWTALNTPDWLWEGYADHVSGGSSLTDEEAETLRARGVAHPALLYQSGRRRVERLLASGMGVDALFRTAGAGRP